jgi:hypothetical protein
MRCAVIFAKQVIFAAGVWAGGYKSAGGVLICMHADAIIRMACVKGTHLRAR